MVKRFQNRALEFPTMVTTFVEKSGRSQHFGFPLLLECLASALCRGPPLIARTKMSLLTVKANKSKIETKIVMGRLIGIEITRIECFSGIGIGKKCFKFPISKTIPLLASELATSTNFTSFECQMTSWLINCKICVLNLLEK